MKFFVLIFLIAGFSCLAEAERADLEIRKILIQGHYSFTRQEVLNILEISENQRVSAEQIRLVTEKIEKHYRASGYTLCEVEGWLSLERDLIIQIYEGVVEDLIFLRLDYLQMFLIRDQFGDYRNKTFYQPLLDEKLKKAADVAGISGFRYEFLPVENKKGYYYLFVSRVSGVKKQGERQPYTDIYFNFRGWILSLVPYINLTFHNMGGLDHALRFSADVRIATPQWFSGKLGVVNEYYTVNYFSPPVFNQVRMNFQTGALINRQGREDLEASFKTMRVPLQAGFGYDLFYFWASLRGGYLFERLTDLKIQDEDTLTRQKYPELSKNHDQQFAYFSLTLNREEKKKYILEKDDLLKLNLDYYGNMGYSWIYARLDAEKYLLHHDDVFLFRFRAMSMLGKYPVYYQPGLSDEYHLRGYGALYSSHSADLTLEHWNSIYKDQVHSILFIDAGVFDNETYKNSLSAGNFAMSWGVGGSYSFQEINFRIYYALPMKQKAHEGKFDFFFRRRF